MSRFRPDHDRLKPVVPASDLCMSRTNDNQGPIEAFFCGRLNYERQQARSYNERSFRLRPLQCLLQALDNPQHAFAVVHVAGTKGKGSVCAMIHQVLHAAGYRSGLYTSPHLQHLAERFVVGQAPASNDQLLEVIRQLQPAVAAIDQRSEKEPHFGGLTFFDLCTAAAFVFFQQQAVQIAVVEVGMGGRLDSTNLVRPCLSLVTNISLDHTQQLGETVEQIAREKAGIIKPGIPVISGVQDPAARSVIVQSAASNGSPLMELGKQVTWSSSTPAWGPCRLTWQDPATGRDSPPETMCTPLLGSHQRDNLALAYAAVHCLRLQGWQLPPEAVRHGIAQARPIGRMQIVQSEPLVMLDVAHNPASFAALVTTLRRLEMSGGAAAWAGSGDRNPDSAMANGTPRQRRLVFAVSQDKDRQAMLRIAADYFDQIVLTRFHLNPRACDPQQLGSLARQVTDPLRPWVVAVEEDPQRAYQETLRWADPRDWIVVAGSLFLLAEIGSWSPAPAGVK